MACNYKIILKTGEVISFPSSLNDNNFDIEDFRESLKKLSPEEVKNIIDKIENSENKPLEVSSLNLSNVIKTTSLNKIMSGSSTVFIANDISLQLLENSKNLIKKLKQQGTDTRERNVIYTATRDLFDTNYGNAYDFDSNTFIINSSLKGDINFISLNKALIDIYILKHSDNIRKVISENLNNPEKQTVRSVVENLPNLYKNNKINRNIVKAIKEELELSDELFDYIYGNHSDLVENVNVYEGKTKDDMKMFARHVFTHNKEFLEDKETYYSESVSTDLYPILKVGDLIKVPSNLKQGRFGIYLDEYTKNVKGVPEKQYVVLTVNSDGKGIDWRSYSENDLKFTNTATKQGEFVIRKKLSNVDEVVIDRNQPAEIYHITEPFSINAEEGKRLPTELIRLLKKGDKVVMNYKKRKDVNVYSSTLKEVVGVKGNSIYLKQVIKKKATVSKHSIGGLFLTSVTVDLENHPDIKNFDAVEFREARQKNKTLFYEISVNDANRAEMLKELMPGDIVATKQGNNEQAAYFNYYFGDLNENTALIALNKKDGGFKTIKALGVNKSSIVKIIHNLADKVHLIDRYKELKPEIEETFKMNIFLNASPKNSMESDNLIGRSEIAKENNRYSLYDVTSDTKKSHSLKVNLSEGDFVEINQKYYTVLENNDGALKLYGNSELTKNTVDNVDKIVKIEPEFSIYSEKTLQMNTPLVSTSSEIAVIFDDVDYTPTNKQGQVEMKYVIKKKLVEDIPWVSGELQVDWDNGEVKGAYFVDIDFYNSRREEFIDLSKPYTNKNLVEKASIYAYKKGGVIMNNILGTTSFLVRNLNHNKLFEDLTVGSYLRFENIFKTFRVEEKTEAGLLLSYTFKDVNGNIATVFEFKNKDFLQEGNGNKVFNLFIPNVQTNSIKKFKNQKEKVSAKHEQKISDRDRIELLSEISSYLSNNFSIPVIIGSTNDFTSNPDLAQVKQLASAKSFIFNGKIYVNSDFASLSDPLHESLHLILGTFKVLNPKLYEEILINMKNREEDYEQVKNTYEYLTHYEILEEVFVESFAKQIMNKINEKSFNNQSLLLGINEAISEILQLEENDPDTYNLLNSSIESVINEFGSKFVNNVESMYDRNASNLSNKITNAKRELIKNEQLKEECR